MGYGPFKQGGINTAYRRWFWRVRHRYTDRWWELPDWYVRRELRMKSWRKPL